MVHEILLVCTLQIANKKLQALIHIYAGPFCPEYFTSTKKICKFDKLKLAYDPPNVVYKVIKIPMEFLLKGVG